MIQTGFETRVKIQEVLENQVPEFILSDSPKAVDFLKQYYISQEFQGGTVDIIENLDQYLKLDILTPEVVNGETLLTNDITDSDSVIFVETTKGYPNQYGLLKIDDEIITYTGITTNSFTGCIRGFSGITTYQSDNSPGELIFVTTKQNSHSENSKVYNLSILFLKEFYKKIKFSLTPGLENYDFVSDLNVSTFIKEAKSFYQAKGTDESFRILFNVLYGVDPKVVNLEDYLIKPSSAEFLRREILLTEKISGADPLALIGQTIRKSTDFNTQASVSSVEPLTRSGKTYYKITLFIGYGDNSLIDGIFTIPGKTKVIEDVASETSIITVDSTIGFEKSGSLICNSKVINYTDKTINQFLGCFEEGFETIVTPISSTSDIRSSEVIYGYENGDTSKKVELRITGVLNKFVPKNLIYSAIEGEKIYVKNLGEQITNPDNKTYKQFFANSWIYNTSSRYQIRSIQGATFTLISEIDKSSLAVGDVVDILPRNSTEIIFTGAVVSNINAASKQIILNNLSGFVQNPLIKYDLRRKLKKASSATVPIRYGNNKVVSDIQNFYNANNEYFYVASNSLPSYTLNSKTIEITLSDASGSSIQGYNPNSLKYSIISFDKDVPFISGDSIYYKPNGQPIPGLDEGRYYVEVLSNPNQIKLYTSRSFVLSSNYIEFSKLPPQSGSHTFTLFEYANKIIGPQALLKKFPSLPNTQNGNQISTKPGTIGMLINGVEILNYKSKDTIHYGPIENINIISGGDNYDVLNPPRIEVSNSIGSTAFIQPVVKGSLVDILVDPQDFDIKKIISITIEGGNSSQVILQPIIEEKFREVYFDGRLSSVGGGIDPFNETLTFLTNHNFFDGQEVIYDSNQNNPIGVSSFYGTNVDQNKYLSPGNVYYIKNINNRTVRLFGSLSDYVSGINTVGFSTINTQGTHKFRVAKGKKTLKSIKIANQGSSFENRRLIVKPSSINLTKSLVSFQNHGFNDGDLISYETNGTSISGLSTTSKYFILTEDKNNFRLCDAGTEGVNRENFAKKNFVKFLSQGSGYQIFKYPDIQIKINAEYTESVGIITATPIIKGKIVDAYLYEKGSDYGSKILNFHKKPLVDIKLGKTAQIKPIVSNGRIINCEVQNTGREYYSPPDLIVEGDGIGAKLRAIIDNDGSISKVIIINPGLNYKENNTKVKVSPRGSGAILDLNVRELTVNNIKRYGPECIFPIDKEKDLEYVWIGYSTSISKNVFNDNGISHSPLIGWAYDGNPIYGPYGYSDPEDTNSRIKIINSGYTLDPSSVENRPSNFGVGFFIEDYKFVDAGDLDINNGRFCKTPEFPNGVYAYFATVENDLLSNSSNPSFPYFIGNCYRSNFLEENDFINQDFDFNNSNLIRNTFPYKVFDYNAGNDFLIESNELINQFSIVESVSDGSVSSIEIKEPGEGYKVYDLAVFDNEETGGGGISAYVEEVYGKEINKIQTTIETYDNSIIVQNSQNEILVSTGSTHNFKTNDSIVISNLSDNIFNLTRSHNISVPEGRCYVYKNISSNLIVGMVTDIYVSDIPKSFKTDSVLGIGSELVQVLNIFSENRIIRIKRNTTGIAHSTGDSIVLAPNSFIINQFVSSFDSAENNKIYFNPFQSVGVGTTSGISNLLTHYKGDISEKISVPNQSIYIPNHPFKTNQLIKLGKTSSGAPIQVSNTPSSTPFYILNVDNEDEFYVINQSKNYIGIVTSVGLTTSTNGLYFVDNGSDNYEYYIESNFDQVTAKVQKIVSTITLDQEHNLNNGDNITLEVKPNQTIGIAATIPLKLFYNSSYDRLIVNPIGFSSSGINTSTNTITVSSHGLKTGDKIFYNSLDPASGLSIGDYFVYRVSDNILKLTETYNDLLNINPNFVDIVSIGGTHHEIARINPPVNVYKNNNLIFDTSDSSLLDYKLKIFYDQDFKNEFVSTGSTALFTLSGVGTVGLSTNSSLTLKYSNSIPSKLYYSLEKSGFISTSDKDVKNANEIIFQNSLYNGTYSISGIGSTTFNINLNQVPETLQYNKQNVESFEYKTNSLTAVGGVSKVRLTFGGANYKKIPVFKEFITQSGKNAFIVANSDQIGKLDSIRVFDPGFEYSTDKTLRPEAYISPLIKLKNVSEVSKIDILDGGKNYTSSPDFVLVNPTTRKVITDGLIQGTVISNTISKIDVIQPPRGLDFITHELFAINNSNAISVESIESSEYSGIVTCYLTTPVFGFTIPPFETGDKIFVEGIEKENNSVGDGFNSADYGYQFFEVVNYLNTNPAKLEYQFPDNKSNPGLAKQTQNSYASIINKKNYPVFSVVQKFSNFLLNEKLLVLIQDKFVEKDIIITDFRKENLKIYGTDTLKVGDIIRGKDSGSIAEIRSIDENLGFFEIEYSLRKDYGWTSDTGKLNQDYQVLPDNDYYQNLSYTVKSPITYEDLRTPVNGLLHTAGLKNFADVGITSSAKISIGSSTVTFTNVFDFINEERVDTIRNFVLGQDIDTVENKSKFIQVKNIKLTDYIECKTNRVLNIDDVSALFSNRENQLTDYVDIIVFATKEDYTRSLIQIIDPNTLETQAAEIFIFKEKNKNNIFTFTRQILSSTLTELGDIYGNVDPLDGLTTLRFSPYKPLTGDYDIKVLKNNFNTTLSGIGTRDLNSVKLVGVNTYVGINSTGSIIKVGASSISGLFANVQIINTTTLERDFAEVYLTHDGSNTYRSEYFLNTNEDTGTFSNSFIGTFSSNIESGILSLDFNSENASVLVKTEIIGFASTTLGIATYTFLSPKQTESSSRSAKLFSNYSISNGVSTVCSVPKGLFTTVKSYVKVGSGETSTLHQVLLTHNQEEVFTTQYPYLSSGNNVTGLGTFGGVYNGTNIDLLFYPDPGYLQDTVIQSFNEAIYTFSDTLNIPLDLNFGTITESIILSQYNAINGKRINRKTFTMTNSNIPIFMKTFDPEDSNVLNPVTGVFSIPNHFFETGERLIYRPTSSFIGVAATSVGIGSTLNSSGIVTTILPSEVYAIKIDGDTFKVSTRKDYSLLGIGVTFTSLGSGNQHQFEMYKKNEKTIISIDGVIQSPVAYTPFNYFLENNGGQIGIGMTYVSLSGISSVYPDDVLKIDNEFMRVETVGFGTTNTGPIIGFGTFPLVQVERGIFGTSELSHSDSTEVRVYSGTYNIIGNSIHFISAPRGDSSYRRNESNVLDARSTFSGRVFLKTTYDDNVIFDDMSRSFDGFTREYPLTVQGINTTGIETGSGLVLINNVFQAPSTENNPKNNYDYIESVGVSSIVFSGITSSNGSIIRSDFDINQNQLPRGGIIVSLASTDGIGYAPLVGASVTAIVGAGGSIQAVGVTTIDVYGSGYNGNVSVAVTESGHTGLGATITATVGVGGTLQFNVIYGGTGYLNPTIVVSEPSYQNLPIIGVSRRGIGQTTECGKGLLLNVEVGSSQTELSPISGKHADASNLINANKQLIAEVSVGRMLNNYPSFSVPGGSQNCISDVISVLDCLTFNLRYGGNERIYDAAKLYVDNGYLSGEEEQSIYTFMQAKDLAIQAMRNEAITIGGYSTISQYFDNTVEGDISGLPGVYNPGDCSDIASAIDSFVGIVTFSIRDNTIPTSRVAVTTSFFEVTNFEVSRQGYGFRIGDEFKPVGLVTDGRLGSPIKEFTLTVVDVFNDSFSSWRFGQLDYIDSIKSLQNGTRNRFPLFYKGELLSFETNLLDPDSERIDLNSVLVIFVNGVLQTPVTNYVFTGGTSVSFTSAPRPEDDISIFFYRGTRNQDSYIVSNVSTTLKVGDNVILERNNNDLNSISQDSRTIQRIASSDKIETNNYTGQGIEENTYKPLSWTKQKEDKLIYGEIVSKTRNSIESLVFPASKIIKDFSTTDTEIFVDDAEFFQYEENYSALTISELGGIIIDNKNPRAGKVTPTILDGSVQSFTINDGGSGYIGTSITIKVSAPERIGVGIGTTASATISIVNGELSTPIVITNPGYGYDENNPPNTIVPFPPFKVENIINITGVEGFTGIITGITTSSGTSGNPLALKFFLRTNELDFTGLNVGYPILIYDTNVGNGVTSINTSENSIVGIGSTFLDNIYYIHSITSVGNNAEIISNVKSNSNVIGISTIGTTINPVGKFSWGRLYGFSRSAYPISIGVTGFTVDSGLSTYPNIQRRGYGIRDTGGLEDKLL